MHSSERYTRSGLSKHMVRVPVGSEPSLSRAPERRNLAKGITLTDLVVLHVIFDGTAVELKKWKFSGDEVSDWSVDLIQGKIPKGHGTVEAFESHVKERLGVETYDSLREQLNNNKKEE